MASRELNLYSTITTRRAARCALALTAGLLAFGVALWSGLSEKAGMALYDAQMRWQLVAKRGTANSDAPAALESGAPLALVAIDQSSLDWVQKELGLGWPWPRELYGAMAGYLRGARAQAWDILFTEASTYGPEDDARCANAMSEAGNVALATLIDKPPVFGAANLTFGHVAADVDSDGICRKYRVWIDRAGNRVPSLGLAALDVAERGGLSVASGIRGSANLALKTDAAREKWLKFWPRTAFTRYSAAQILAAAMASEGSGAGSENGASAPPDFAGKIVVVGITAPGLMDRQATPIDPSLPGMEVHATYIEDALAGNFMSRAPWWIEALAALAVAFSLSGLPLLRRRKAASLGVALALAAPLAASALLFSASIFFNPLSAEIAGLASFIAAMGLGYRAEGRQRAYLRRAFAQYLSPEVIATLVETPERLKLGGESRVISVLFSDLEGFTAISERLGPEQLARFMNEYLEILSAEILEQGGTLDKYVGDAVVAFWNAPLDVKDHALRALASAARIQKKLAAAAPSFASRYGVAPRTRIGVATGPAVVGNLGSSLRFTYTAVGDSVNVASRLEAANKATGTLALTMGETVAAALAEAIAAAREPGDASDSSAVHAMPPSMLPDSDFSAASVSKPFPDSGTLPASVELRLAGGEILTLKRLGPAIMQGKSQPIELWTIEFEISNSDTGKTMPEPWIELRHISK